LSEILKGGRVSGLREDALKYVSSIRYDEKILKHVLDVNKAHVIVLVERGIISKEDGSRILEALLTLDENPPFRLDVEDIHVLIEEEVIKRAGIDVGGNLNIAKSRNDQVATAIRMALREEILGILEETLALQGSLLEVADKNINTVLPGYTHLQPAQPITFAHYLLSHFDALSRDLERIFNAYRHVNLCPMGAGALSTTSFPISRERVMELLGFDGLIENSIDAVRSRDFLLETLAALSVMAVNLSYLLEDLIIWSSMEFGLIELPDEFTSTSSIMPQKKNPDVLEVMRARMGLILGNFIAVSIVLKSLPSVYNLDFQEATPRLWDACEVMRESLKVLSELVRGLKVKVENIDKPIYSFMAATEVANMLVRKYGIPFRVAHKIIGSLVKILLESGKTLKDVTPRLLAEVSANFLSNPIQVKEEDLHIAVSLAGFLESHSVRGGPSRREVKRMLSERKILLSKFRDETLRLKETLSSSRDRLNSLAKLYSLTSLKERGYDSKV